MKAAPTLGRSARYLSLAPNFSQDKAASSQSMGIDQICITHEQITIII